MNEHQGHWILAKMGKRILGMRKIFREYQENLNAVTIIALKK